MLIFPQFDVVILTVALLAVTALSYLRRTLVTDLGAALALLIVPYVEFVNIVRTHCN